MIMPKTNTKLTEEELERIAADHAAGVDISEPGVELEYDDGRSATGSATITVRMPMSMIAALKDQSEREDIGVTVLARNLIAKGLAEGGRLDPEGVAAHIEEAAHLLREYLASKRQARGDLVAWFSEHGGSGGSIDDAFKRFLIEFKSSGGSIDDDAFKRLTEYFLSGDSGLSARADQESKR
jgi:hypothetical protein